MFRAFKQLISFKETNPWRLSPLRLGIITGLMVFIHHIVELCVFKADWAGIKVVVLWRLC
ncbi:MAG: hypothetical protein D4R76_03800 [Methylococcus sp.]|nr:MAG: hypothetical protein D4R76_03800 [Methylococcus sp.]